MGARSRYQRRCGHENAVVGDLEGKRPRSLEDHLEVPASKWYSMEHLEVPASKWYIIAFLPVDTAITIRRAYKCSGSNETISMKNDLKQKKCTGAKFGMLK